MYYEIYRWFWQLMPTRARETSSNLNFFADSNTIDSHNQVRQSNIALEKKWLTKDPFFRLMTSLIGICVTDSWKLVDYHKLINIS